MHASKTSKEFEEHWKEYLQRLERSWNKARAHYGKSPKWTGWQSKIERARRTDELLSYLENARGAEEHSVDEIVEHAPSGIGINPASGNSLYIEKMEMKDGILSVWSPQKLKVEFLPGRMSLIPIVNRGRTYKPPSSHCGASINPVDVIGIAELGFKFYAESLQEAEAFFVK
jgi:hypothetical protein